MKFVSSKGNYSYATSIAPPDSTATLARTYILRTFLETLAIQMTFFSGMDAITIWSQVWRDWCWEQANAILYACCCLCVTWMRKIGLKTIFYTSSPCRYWQKVGFAGPWETVMRTRRQNPGLPVTRERRLMKRTTAQHCGVRMELDRRK